MIARKYADFETLHEVLRRISVITGEVEFTDAHAELPRWRGNSKASLRTALERYIMDAVRHQPLAESEGMKRFLEKDQGLERLAAGHKAFGWPTPDAFGKLGGDMMNVLTKAPKQVAGGVAGGGKAVLGGVAGLVGSVGVKKLGSSQADLTLTRPSRTSSQEPQRPSMNQMHSYSSSLSTSRMSVDSSRTFGSGADAGDGKDDVHLTAEQQSTSMKSPPRSAHPSFEISRKDQASMITPEVHVSPTKEDMLDLPPRPSEMPADFALSPMHSRTSTETFRTSVTELQSPSGTLPIPPTPTRPSSATFAPKAPISEHETTVAIELMFAVITELYTLSSAWNIRRTLLNAAKSFLLRPGNPQLLAIRELLQTSLLDANLSDAGLASHIYKLRENCLPTETELETWKSRVPAQKRRREGGASGQSPRAAGQQRHATGVVERHGRGGQR